MSELARRYASVAIDSLAAAGTAATAEHIDALAQDLRSFLSLHAGHGALQEILKNPVLKPNREAVLTPLLKQMGLSTLAVRLVCLLAHNDRIGLIADVVGEVEALADARAGRLRAQVRCAMAPTPAQVKALQAALKKRLGKTVVTQIEVQPELLGGLVCQVDCVTFDTSLRRQLALLSEQLGAHV
jgi:F-type H+-transporting ATPase subunit delta